MATKPGHIVSPDGMTRCFWCAADPVYVRYHDTEWGFPVFDDRQLFEKIILEGFQSGLSWLTILRKRENFRAAFDGFSIEKVARYTPRTVERLLCDAGIVRHRGKIESTINNSRRCADLIDAEGSLSRFVWGFEPDPMSRPRTLTWKTLMGMPTTAESVALSKAFKQRGWKFVGPTTVYAFMQAMGLVNDHLHGCDVRERAEAARTRLRR